MKKKHHSLPEKIWIYLRSYAFLIIGGSVMGFFLMPMFFIKVFGSISSKAGKKLTKKCANTCIFLYKYVAGIQIHQHHDTPESKDCSDVVFFIISHNCGLDIPLYIHTKNLPIRAVCKIEYKSFPFFSFINESFDCVFIQREKPKESLKKIHKAISWAIENNAAIMMAPQGTRSNFYAPIEFKAGAAVLIKMNKLKKIGIIGHNFGEHTPPKKVVQYPGNVHYITKIVPVDPTQKADDITKYLENEMQKLVDKTKTLL